MSESELDIIATRTVWEEQTEGEFLPIIINICRPIIDKDSEFMDWECMYQILRDGDDLRRKFYGVDPIQALYCSLASVGIELSTSDIQTPQEETEYGVWNEENNFGFPPLEKD